MRRKGGMLLPFTVFVCLCLMACGAYICLKDTKRITALNSENETVSAEKKNSGVAEISKSVDNTAVAVSSDRIGSIITEFLSPYRAYGYNNVYLKNGTSANIDIKEFLSAKPKVKIENTTEPQVLIVHTHATECYMNENRDYFTASDRTTNDDNSMNVTAVGDTVADILNNAGIVCVHDKTQHDNPSYTGSYSRSYETISRYLSEYPSIKVVIDLHRDSVGTADGKVKPIVEIDGNKVAQVMLVMGSENDGITGFPNWRDNLAFAVKYQQFMEVMYPGLARAVCFYANRYNEQLTPGSILLEVGTEANTLKEAKDGAALAAKALVAYLNTLK